MVLDRYFQNTFLQKTITTLLIFTLIVVFTDTLQISTKCKDECGIFNVLSMGLKHGIIFVDEALFFVITISSMWFAVHAILTSQMQIATIYTQSHTFVIKNCLIALLKFCIVYFVLFDLIGTQFLYSEKHQEKYTKNQSVWISNPHEDSLGILNITDTTTDNNSIHATVYQEFNIDGINTTKHAMYRDVSILNTESNDATLLTNGKIIPNDDLKFSDAVRVVTNETTPPRGMLRKGITSAIQQTTPLTPIQLSILHIASKYLSLFAPVVLCLIFYTGVNSARSNAFGVSMLKTIISATILFTAFEVIKIVDTYSIPMQQSALMLVISVTSGLFYIFVKPSRI